MPARASNPTIRASVARGGSRHERGSRRLWRCRRRRHDPDRPGGRRHGDGAVHRLDPGADPDRPDPRDSCPGYRRRPPRPPPRTPGEPRRPRRPLIPRRPTRRRARRQPQRQPRCSADPTTVTKTRTVTTPPVPQIETTTVTTPGQTTAVTQTATVTTQVTATTPTTATTHSAAKGAAAAPSSPAKTRATTPPADLGVGAHHRGGRRARRGRRRPVSPTPARCRGGGGRAASPAVRRDLTAARSSDHLPRGAAGHEHRQAVGRRARPRRAATPGRSRRASLPARPRAPRSRRPRAP